MNDLVEFAIERNCDRILHSERGEQYDGCEDDLREGLRLLAAGMGAGYLALPRADAARLSLALEAALA